ncbi:MAG: hypothetical protein KOO63_07850 [Bacteroidales bacterium]|nr:hypothetical protein [Candidatus Latescibacterota bacterium]
MTLDRAELVGQVAFFGTIILIVVMVCCYAVTRVTFERDREEACSAVGGQVVKDLAPGIHEGCYLVTTQYEALLVPGWRE